MSVSFYLNHPPRQVTHLENLLNEAVRLLGKIVTPVSVSISARGDTGPRGPAFPYKNPPESQHNKGHSARCNIPQREFPEKLDLSWKEIESYLQIVIS